jgi:hypothetical protein
MSSEGLISVRLPRSLFAAFQTVVERQRITVHSAAQQLLDGLNDLSAADLRALPNPPQEGDSPRLSLYVGIDGVDDLDDFVHSTGLSRSTIFRRLLYGLLIDRSLRFVQRPGDKWHRLVRVQSTSK